MIPYSELKQIWNDIQNDIVMKWTARVLFIGIVICFFITAIATWIRGARNKPVVFLWGLYSSSEKDTIKITKIDTVYFYKKVSDNSSRIDKSIKVGKQEVDRNGISIQNNAPNYGSQAGRDINNYGIIPRKITEDSEIILALNSVCLDKSKHIGFVAPSNDGEIINVKKQIIDILVKQGFVNIENTNGIRLMLDSNLPSDHISLMNNAQGGFSFYIPPAGQ